MNTKLEQFKSDIKGKSVGVIGIGVSNTPLINFLVACGADVTARDKKSYDQLGDTAKTLEALNVKLKLGDEYLDNIYENIIFKTPGIRYDVPELNAARENGCIVTSEMEVFFDLCPAEIIAITGSDGKTTTTTLVYELLKKSGYKCWLGGNIGNPLLSDVDKISSEDKVVLELSSFQLHTMKKSPKIAVITNLSPNHLDYHKDMEEYIDAKKNIYRYQTDDCKVILNYDNKITNTISSETKSHVFFSRQNQPEGSFYIKDGCIVYDGTKILETSKIRLPGVHNIENYMAAIAAVWGMVSVEVINDIAINFGGVKHRIEFVRELNGVKYYNDSIASSPTRAKAGLYSFDQKIILIAGGYDKKIPFDDFGNDIVKRVKLLILVGATAPKIEEAVLKADNYEGEPKILNASNLLEAVKSAYENATEGDIVSLSPACASFDMFKNFEERGNAFKQYVMELK